jgi:hypothetical protein
MTGSWNHSPGHFFVYAVALLLGKQGFLGHNLPLFLAVLALVPLLRMRLAERPELLWAASWCGGSWLAYSLTSTNYSGLCCSVRWFVPLLAPGYLVLAMLLRQAPRFQTDLLLLSSWGAVLIGIAWWHGPWIQHMVPFFWPIQVAALASWMGLWAWRRRRVQSLPADRALADAA